MKTRSEDKGGWGKPSAGLVCSGAVRAVLLAVPLALAPLQAAHADGKRNLSARLSGYNEVHFAGGPPATLRGAVSTVARGSFKAVISDVGDRIDYELTYSGLEGAVTQAHIHFGQQYTTGTIMVWLCQSAGTPAPAEVAAVTPICPQEGTVTGTIMAPQLLTVAAGALQGLEGPAEFAEFVRAVRAGATYANVHSAKFLPGEIRGQID